MTEPRVLYTTDRALPPGAIRGAEPPQVSLVLTETGALTLEVWDGADAAAINLTDSEARALFYALGHHIAPGQEPRT
jgi:hypothetical protein